MTTEHGRLPWYHPATLDTPRRALYEEITAGPRAAGPQAFALTDGSGRLEGPFNAMLTAPDVGRALQQLGTTIRYATGLPARWREIAILQTAAVRRSRFEWYAHERVGRAAGLTEAELTAIATDTDVPTLDQPERTVREVCRELLVHRDLNDELYARAERDLGIELLYELVVLVGYYDLLALSLRAFRTPLPAGETPGFG